jgi:hypothetical protein
LVLVLALENVRWTFGRNRRMRRSENESVMEEVGKSSFVVWIWVLALPPAMVNVGEYETMTTM